MTREDFYAQLCYVLLNKFCKGHVDISASEWDLSAHKGIGIKHRINKDGNLEIMTYDKSEVNE